MQSERNGVSRKTVADAAIGCFQRYGVHRTSMADVAQAVGVSRQTVYRVFPTRPDLLEFIVAQRIADMAELLMAYFSTVDSLEEALVEGSLLSMRAGRGDALFQEIIAKSGEHSIDQFMFRGSNEIQQLMLSLWGPVLDKARARGQLRPGVTNSMAVEWIRNQHSVLTMRDDYDEAAQRHYLSTFVVPSLVASVRPD